MSAIAAIRRSQLHFFIVRDYRNFVSLCGLHEKGVEGKLKGYYNWILITAIYKK
jgi:hypothetical protein